LGAERHRFLLGLKQIPDRREWLIPLGLADQHLVGRMVALGGEAEE
jgi:hypothetical protein